MKKIVCCLAIAVLSGCTVTKDGGTWHPAYRVQGGLNKGGITENTDFTKTPEIQPDAFSGATKTGVHTSGHIVIPFKRNSIETGVDFMHNNQKFAFNDNTNGFNGKRDIGLSQFMLPITYNFGLFRKNNSLGNLQIKIGYLLQFNFFSVSDHGANLPGFTVKHFSNGFTVGLSATPFQFNNGNRLGFYLDGYRGTKVYDDFYNSSIYEMPGSSFVKFGVFYQFGKH